MTLVSPAGRQAVLHARLGGSEDNLVMVYRSAPPSPLAALVGQSTQGKWLLNIADLAAQDVGTLNKWSLDLTVSG